MSHSCNCSAGRIFLLILWHLIAFPVAAIAQPQPSQIEPCMYVYREAAGACMQDAQKNMPNSSNDYSFFGTCMKKFEPELNACRGRTQCRIAKIAIDWVMAEDRGAQRSYAEARGAGKAPYQAVMYAQRHNPPAAKQVAECANWSQDYIARTYPNGPVPLGAAPGIEKPPSSAAGERPAGSGNASNAGNCAGEPIQRDMNHDIIIDLENSCDGPVTLAACFVWSNGAWMRDESTFSGRKSPVTMGRPVSSIGPGVANAGIRPEFEKPRYISSRRCRGANCYIACPRSF